VESRIRNSAQIRWNLGYGIPWNETLIPQEAKTTSKIRLLSQIANSTTVVRKIKKADQEMGRGWEKRKKRKDEEKKKSKRLKVCKRRENKR
jgi:hypothetical protein